MIVVMATLGNAAIASYRYINYSHLQAHASLIDLTTEVKEITEASFYVDVNYTFLANGKTYSGSSHSSERYFLNRWAAEENIKEIAVHAPKVWYDPQNPHYSSLIKKFPARDIGTALALLGLLIYFVWLGFRVGRGMGTKNF